MKTLLFSSLLALSLCITPCRASEENQYFHEGKRMAQQGQPLSSSRMMVGLLKNLVTHDLKSPEFKRDFINLKSALAGAKTALTERHPQTKKARELRDLSVLIIEKLLEAETIGALIAHLGRYISAHANQLVVMQGKNVVLTAPIEPSPHSADYLSVQGLQDLLILRSPSL